MKPHLDWLLHARIFEDKEVTFIIALIFGLLTFASLLFFVIGKIKPNANLKELKTRTKSWWIMSSLFIVTTVFSVKISYFAIAFLSFIAFRELYSILGFRQSDRRAIFWALLSIPVQYYLAYAGWYGAFIIFIPVVMFLLLPLRLVLKGDTSGIVKSMATLQWILMLTVFGISHLAFLLSLPGMEGFNAGGRGLLLFVVFLTEINDVMQFVWGKLFGKHKIIPKVSPNKTWEGFLGGIISTTIIGYFLGFLTPLTTGQLIFVSFLVANAGFFGDIVMSSLKRDIGVKDTGSAIPGHGGILDRIDSLAYTAPAFFHLVYWFCYPALN
jgi:phosphatidate cytidylyltransferase